MKKTLDALSANLSTKETQKLVVSAACILNSFGIDVEPLLDQHQDISKYRGGSAFIKVEINAPSGVA